jgi:hypothetical protein
MVPNTAKKMPPPVGGATTQATPSADRFAVVAGRVDSPQRVLLYGPGGIGKSTLASMAPGAVFIDIEGGTGELDVPRVEGVQSFADLRAVLQSTALDAYQTIILDSATKAEEWASAHTLEHVKHEKGHRVDSLEGYGFGKGYMHLYDTFLLLLADLDGQVRRGRNVVLIAHECIVDAPNPFGDDFIRYEPHLQNPKSGKASIRNRVVQWADHVLFIGYDVMTKDGKGQGGGTRTIYTSELPSHIAKSRRASLAVPFTGPDDGEIWNTIIGGTK